jgi:hypothetical protein
MPAICPSPQIEAFFLDLFRRLYEFDIDFDSQRTKMENEKGGWSHEDMEEIVARKSDLLTNIFSVLPHNLCGFA